jgi:predicted dithiol-disulfide oxidoreductase (DUF899 family)
MHGSRVFYKDASGDVFHTYSCYARAGEETLGAYGFLDLTPKGRNQTINGNLTDWERHQCSRLAVANIAEP